MAIAALKRPYHFRCAIRTVMPRLPRKGLLSRHPGSAVSVSPLLGRCLLVDETLLWDRSICPQHRAHSICAPLGTAIKNIP